MQLPQDRTIRAGQINTRYWAEGDRGSTVLLLHGVGGYVERWLPIWAALAARHRVYAPDMLGCGRTDKPSSVTYSWDTAVRFVSDLMAALGIEQASLVGHSAGGGAALLMALRFPSRVEKLVLVSSGGLGKEMPLQFRFLTLPVLGEVVTRLSPQGSDRELAALAQGEPALAGELLARHHQMAAQPGAQRALLKTLRWAFGPFGPYERYYGPILRGLPSIQQPTLIIWGQQDPYFPVAHARAAAGRLPDARLHIFDPCGHLPMIEHAQAFNALLLEFLGGCGEEPSP